MQINSRSVKATLKFGKALARQLCPGDIVCLSGELGSGKTTLTKGIAAGLGVDKQEVTSSSFILIRQHLGGRIPLYHFDLYRLKVAGVVATLGYEEYFYAAGVSVIEWAERLKYLMPKERLMVELTYGRENTRRFKLSAFGIRYKKLLRKLDENISH